MSSLKKCTACGNELHQSLFSKTQWKKGQDRRCKECIETNNQPLKKKRRVGGNDSSKEKAPTEEAILSDFVFVYTGKGVPKNVVLVHFDSSVVRISNKAFSNCNHLKEVILNEGLKSIGNNAFSGCNSLQSVTLPTTIVDIGSDAFRSCTSLREVVLNDGLEKIKSSAFCECSSLQSVTLPTTIVDIGSNAFINCDELKEVVLNEGLRSIGSSAFYNCRSLEIISFPSTINTVSRNAFIKCKSLKRITLANENVSKRLESIVQAGHVEVLGQIDSIPMRGSVERQGSEMIISEFAVKTTEKGSWKKPESLDQVEQLIAYYEMKEATTILFELAVWKVKIDQAGDSVNRDACRVGVPKLVKDSILQYLFNAETSVSVPLEKIYTYTGDGCVPKNVVVVNVHSSVVDIRESEFRQCRYLRVIVLNEGLRSIGTQAFTDCCSLQSISFPSTLTEVGDSAFDFCTSLREVVFNEGLRSIGNAAFSNCKSLEHIFFPSTLIEIGDIGPYECVCDNDYWIEFGCNCGYEDKLCGVFEGCSMMREVVFNEGLKTIGDDSFKSCTHLKEVVLNEGLEEIGEGAFHHCSSLESVALPSTLNETDFAFCMCCISLKRITLPYISKRLQSIVQAGHVEFMSKIDEIRGIVKRQWSEIYIPASAIQLKEGWQGWKKRDETIKALLQCLDRIKRLIAYHEMKEVGTLFELALWKAMIDEAGDPVNRDACRVGVPNLVKDSILQYLMERPEADRTSSRD